MNITQIIRNLFWGLVAVLAVLGVCATQSAMAQGDIAFTNASLRGNYAYINNNGGVASLGPITFDGNGTLSVDILANLPCANTILNCPRTINDLPRASGTYSVEKDGTGIATIAFSSGAVTYNFMISGAEKEGRTLLATQVFSAGQNGGLAGQLITPTWSRISD